ncbi:MAG TPA: CCA tRNA nucleotidyltransferase [Dehalococcoidia bacterium]|nr:CCA tRNA nucleotidyltransferase [Dehalococcoidia bacterium]
MKIPTMLLHWTSCAILLGMVKVTETISLSDRIEEQLPAAVVGFIRKAGELAEKEQQRLYLVGGVVRDILLRRVSLDFDLVVEGDAIVFAKKLARANRAVVTTHPRFGTAKLQWRNREIDVTTARAESYAAPGTLPEVRPGTITDDLARRDFSVNAMAVELNPRHFGELLDPHGGIADLKAKFIRVLHDKSFTDDATRIWRALRYEQRLEFKIEPVTLKALRRDIDMLDTISGTRIRHELERILEDELPENILRRAEELKVLYKLHPRLRADYWLSETFALTREHYSPEAPPPLLYLALLTYRLDAADTEQLIPSLKLPGASLRILRETQAIKEKVHELATPGLAPSRIYDLLHGNSVLAVTANLLATDSSVTEENIELYLNVLKNVQPLLSGENLKRLGVPEGPRIKEALLVLREAKLDGKINTSRDEEKLIKSWLKKPV